MNETPRRAPLAWDELRTQLDRNQPFNTMRGTPYYRDAVYEQFSKQEYARRYAALRAKMRGVEVHVMARPPHKLKKEKLTESVGGLRTMDDVGIKIHKLKHLKLHAKMLLADDKRLVADAMPHAASATGCRSCSARSSPRR